MEESQRNVRVHAEERMFDKEEEKFMIHYTAIEIDGPTSSS